MSIEMRIAVLWLSCIIDFLIPVFFSLVLQTNLHLDYILYLINHRVIQLAWNLPINLTVPDLPN